MGFVNTYGELNVELPGQEGFTIIQYNPSDEYYPRKLLLHFFKTHSEIIHSEKTATEVVKVTGFIFLAEEWRRR